MYLWWRLVADDSSGEKTEEPTDKRLRDAREKGNVFKSQEVITTSILLGGIVTLVFIGSRVPMVVEHALQVVELDISSNFLKIAGDFASFLFIELLISGCIGMGATFICVLVSHLAQFGFIIATEKMTEGPKKLDIVMNAKNMFAKKSFVTFLFNIFKVIIILLLTFYIFQEEIATPNNMLYCDRDIQCAMDIAFDVIFRFFVLAVLSGVPIAVIDYLVQHALYIQDMKMTKDEVKREYKESDGDPEIKGQRKQIHREILADNQAGMTKQASIVVKNPTHYAVALRYEPGITPLPLIVAKGAGYYAANIIHVAEAEDVPVIENIRLARGLHDACEVYDFVPEDFIEPVARLIRWLYANRPDRVFK